MGSSGVTQQTELLKIWAIQDTEVTPRGRFEGTWQYIRRYLAADSAARRLQLNTEAGTTQSSVQKQQDPTKRFGGRNQGPAETEVSPRRQNYWKIWAIQDTEVTPP